MSIPNQIQEITPVSAALIQDPRWQVVERIVQSPSFQKSERLKAFLTYVVQQYLAGHPEKLTGHQIGIAVFGKTDSYDQAEDNTVRTHARQLRLRLLEYFDSFGRDEPIIIEIPKGSYVPVFRPLHPATVEAGAVVTGAAPAISQELQHSPATTRAERGTLSLGWLAAGILLVLLIAVLARRGVTAFDAAGASSTSSIWPYSALTANGQAVTIVMSDNSFAFFQVAAKRRFHLADYLKTNYPANLSPYLGALASPPLADFTDQLGRKQVTSYADSAIVGAMARFRLATPWLIRPCRDIKAREIQDGSYVLLGSTYSNPWVELYESRLNFVVAPDDPLRA